MKLLSRSSSINAERVRQDIQCRFNPIRILEPENLSHWLDAFDVGDLRMLSRLLDVLSRRDDTWTTAQRKAQRAVARCKVDIKIVEGEESNPQAKEHADVLRDFWANVSAGDILKRNRRGGVSTLVRQMVLAERDVYNVHEIIWRVQNGKLRAHFWMAPLWFFENRTGELRYLQTEGACDGIDMQPGEWLIHTADGVGPACAIASMFKRLSIADWSIYSERCSTPGIHTKTTAQVGSKEWKKAVEATKAFARDFALVTGVDVEMTKIDLTASGTLPQPILVERMDRAIAALWRGADLSTLSADNHGAGLQRDEVTMLEQACCEDISETLQQQIDAFVIRWHFGDNVEPLAYFQLEASVRPNVDNEIKISQHLIRHGVRISKRDELTRFGRRGVEADDSDDESMEKAPENRPQSLGQPITGYNERTEEPELTPLTDAFRDDLAPIREELACLLKVNDEDWATAVAQLREKLPELFREIGTSPEAAKELEHLLSTAADDELPETGAANEGTSEGAFKGWETRRANGWTPKQQEEATRVVGDVLDGKTAKAIYGPVDDFTAEKIRLITGGKINPKGYSHSIDQSFVSHVGKRHGGERDPEQLTITKEDIRKIPEIVDAPDRITSGGESNRGLPTIRYMKKYKDGTVIFVEEEQASEKKMAAKTMWKKKAGNR